MVALANLLNKEMPQYRISVLPTAGAIATVKGYATKELDGFYGSDVAFHELATDSARFKGFKARIQRMPMQSFWSNTIEVGLAIHVRNKDKIKSWADLNGKRVFTGPLPFDTRAQTERALAAIGVKFTYVQVDLATVGSQLESGAHRRHDHLHRLGKLAAAVAGRSLARRRLGGAQSERRTRLAEMKKKGLAVTEVDPKMFNRDTHTDKVVEIAVLLRLRRRPRSAGGRCLQDAHHHREERRRSRQDRSDLHADRQGHEGLPEARRRILWPTSCRSIRVSRNGCARRASGTRSGIPRSPR